MKAGVTLLTVGSLFITNIRSEEAASSQVKEAEEAPKPVLPQWKPLDEKIKAPFFEQFGEDWPSRWSASEAIKVGSDANQSGDEPMRYTGKWSVEEPTVLKVTEGDLGLVVKNAAQLHAISSIFKEPVDTKDSPLVVQYEVKLQNGLECGGAYLKLLTYQEGFEAKDFDNMTPYTIMFGPDKCGSTNKVHFIFRHENPLNHTITEKHLLNPPSAKHATKLTTLYTLVVRPDNTFEILINQESVKKGSLLEDFDPAVNPPKEIEDLDDKKPSDWVDEEQIVDSKAVKPEDWDESEPMKIPDESAVKPEDWLEEEPLRIPDPKAVKPVDWVDEDDGDWVAPEVANPKCEEVSGCGEWVRPTIDNPKYKGKWKAPMIDNPDYKGEWAPRKIPNPDFYEDLKPSHFSKIGGIGFELWTMQNDMLFDNIYVGNSEEEASNIATKTWKVKYAAEEEQRNAENRKSAEEEEIEPPATERLEYALYHTKRFLKLARKDFVGTVQAMPKMAGGLAVAFSFLWLFAIYLLGVLFPGSKPDEAAQRKKDDRPVPDVEPEKDEASPASENKPSTSNE